MIQNIKNRNVYHGSYCVVKKPDIQSGEEGKDFGKGFYITTDYKQSISFAKLKASRYGYPQGYVNIYRLSNLEDLSVYEFTEVNEEWLNCIIGFRFSDFGFLSNPYRNYDVLIGKIADDDTSKVLNAYMSGVYGAIGSPQAVSIALQMLIPNRLKNQLCFKTERSLHKLSFYREEVQLIW